MVNSGDGLDSMGSGAVFELLRTFIGDLVGCFDIFQKLLNVSLLGHCSTLIGFVNRKSVGAAGSVQELLHITSSHIIISVVQAPRARKTQVEELFAVES